MMYVLGIKSNPTYMYSDIVLEHQDVLIFTYHETYNSSHYKLVRSFKEKTALNKRATS